MNINVEEIAKAIREGIEEILDEREKATNEYVLAERIVELVCLKPEAKRKEDEKFSKYRQEKATGEKSVVEAIESMTERIELLVLSTIEDSLFYRTLDFPVKEEICSHKFKLLKRIVPTIKDRHG